MRALTAIVVLLAGASLGALAAPEAAPAASTSEAVAEREIRFTVRNVNRSALPCPSDGATYDVVGRLVAPQGLPGRKRAEAATLYLHEFGWGAFFWRFPMDDVNFARRLAERGHAAVVIDRIGYGASGRPAGLGTCLGSQADVAHQIVEQLKAGAYAGAATQFERVAVAGHSAGGAIAELAEYSFGDIDALLLFAYADQGFTARSIQEATEQGISCSTGGSAGAPPGYAFFAQTEAEWKSFMFHSASAAAADLAAAMRNPDPCGDTASLTPIVTVNNLNLSRIDVPALLLYGTRDAIYQQPQAGRAQADALTGSDDVTLRFFEDTGHALTLERSAPLLQDTVSTWLTRRGFVNAAREPQLHLRHRCIGGGRLRMRVTGDVHAVRDVNFKVDKRLVRRDVSAPFDRVLDARTLRRTSAQQLRAVAYLHDPGRVRTILARDLPRCGPRSDR